jgi:molybdopterin-guanine dinucleotide biosynthesis protein A
MHAIYSRRCLPSIEQHLNLPDLKILNFFHMVGVREIQEMDLAPYDPHCRFVMNINTPRDLEIAREIADSRS